MEIFKVIIHTHGGDRYIDNVVNYILDGRQERAKGYGVNHYDPDTPCSLAKALICTFISFWSG